MHDIKLILEIPLKTADQYFTIFIIISLPTLLFNYTFAIYGPDFDYFGFAYSQRDYILLTASDVQKCSTGSITVCPADEAVFDVRSVTCKSKLRFQIAVKDRPCRRNLILNYEAPTLLWHGDVWFFHFPSRRHLTVRCPRDNTWERHTQMLSGADLIQNVTMCSTTAGEVRTLPELHGTARTNLDTPSVYTPKKLPILTVHEMPDVKMALSTDVNELDQLKNHLKSSRKFFMWILFFTYGMPHVHKGTLHIGI